MQTCGRQSEQRIAGLDRFAGEQFFALHNTDDEAREIVFARRIKAGHLRGFSADERAAGFAAGAAHALDELLDDLWIHFSQGEIVEEKERLGALHQNVVDAVIDEVAANRRVHPHGHSDFELCADAICARNQHGFLPLFVVEGEERAEAADAAEHAGSKRAAGMMPDALLGFIGGGNVYTGIGVFHGGRDPCSAKAQRNVEKGRLEGARNKMPIQEPASTKKLRKYESQDPHL